ncbi:sugar transporter ERD6-like 4 [Neodiprion virginianus]|uniref:sugar transporter ERD6-like 4 n=1 Tax=Neodiprion virginianus TaxID=2961670 RepID=UPI001EE6E2F2|nr:sugar transporter ERD6-like 4 [Neodiprion virginianus]
MMSRDSDRGRYSTPEGSPIWEYFSTASCAMLFFAIGFVPGWNAPTLNMLQKPGSPITINGSDVSNISAAMGFGYMFAPTLTVLITDKLGKKKSLLIAIAVTSTNWGLIAIAQTVNILIVARFISGFAMGMILGIAPMYLGEVASVKIRGAIGMVCSVTMNAGILFTFVVVPYLSVRMVAYISLTLITLAAMCILFIPESPYFLAMVGRIAEAEVVLEKLRGKSDVTEELDLIKNTVTDMDKGAKKLNKGNEPRAPKTFGIFEQIKQIVTVPGNRKAFFINFLVMTWMEFGGYIVIMIFCTFLFDAMHSKISSYTSTIILSACQLVSNVFTAFVIDRVGRRPLIGISGVLSGACLMIITVYYFLMEYTGIDSSPYSTLAVCAMYVNIIVLSIGLVPLQTILMSETIASEVKTLVSNIIISMGGLLGSAAMMFYKQTSEIWGLGNSVPFFVFTITTWFSTMAIMMLLPETKGKTFLEIQRILNK